ncbi:MAG: N-formylglutamate amidohydrolase [Myxococcales bacterium]|nr:N-formylglutamate amidohydrolase [Myxococcales bacterium]
MMDRTKVQEATETIAATPDAVPVILTCEHASNRLPDGWTWADPDLRLVDDHWAFDLGAADVTRELAAQTGAPAILSRFTRLLADPNRPEHAPDLFRSMADGQPVALNAEVTSEDRWLRLEHYHRPYHQTVASIVAATSHPLLLSIHTFTPVYEGSPRATEVGVLFGEHEEEGIRLAELMADQGMRVELNEPYSGKDGFMFSVEHQAQRHQRTALELEIRYDLAQDPQFRAHFVPTLTTVLRQYLSTIPKAKPSSPPAR